MKKTAIYIFFLLILSILVLNYKNTENTIKTPNKIYKVLISNTDQKRMTGLSNTKNLNKDTVMLFIFEKPDMYGIWMKDMLYPIDIVYLDNEMNVVSFFDNVKPSSYPEIFYPEEKSRYIIEMNAGQRLESGLYKNTKVYYK